MPFNQDIHLNDISLVDGIIYPDGWIEPEVSFNVTPPHKGANLKVLIWNPDFAPALAGNQMSIEVGSNIRQVRNIQLSQIVEFSIKPNSTETFLVKFKAERFLPACGYEMRDRASKLIKMQWVDDT